MTKDELLAKIRAGREQLEAALERVPPERRGEAGLHGGWRPADMLAHIAFWENRTTYLLSTLMAGKTPESISGGSIDEVNGRVFQENRQVAYEQARESEQQAYEQMLALVEQASEADLTNPQRFAWTKGQPFYGWIEGNSWEHYEEHIASLDEWLKSGAA